MRLSQRNASRAFAVPELPAVSRAKHGFTLVELLVVIGIIALLISILLPALAAARRSAQQLKCSAQLRTLGQLMAMHAGDHKGYYPLSGEVYTSAAANNPGGVGDGPMLKYDYFYNNSAGPGNTPVPTSLPEALASYLGVNPVSIGWSNVMDHMQGPGPIRDAFMCPSDQYGLEQPPATHSASNNQRWIDYPSGAGALYSTSSYAINQHFFGFTSTGAPPAGQAWSDLRGYISACPNPSDTVLMMDAVSSGNALIASIVPNASLADVYLNVSSANSGVSQARSTMFDLIRHHGLVNILYADGHVDSQPILSTGATVANGAVGSAGNMPSGYTGPGQSVGGGGLGGISVARDLR